MRAIAFATFALLAAVPAATASEPGDTIAEKVCYQAQEYQFESQEKVGQYKSSSIGPFAAEHTINSYEFYNFLKLGGASRGTCRGQKGRVPQVVCSTAEVSVTGLTLSRERWGPWGPC